MHAVLTRGTKHGLPSSTQTKGLSRMPRLALLALLAVVLVCAIGHAAGFVDAGMQQLQAINPNACLRAAFTSGLKDRSV